MVRWKIDTDIKWQGVFCRSSNQILLNYIINGRQKDFKNICFDIIEVFKNHSSTIFQKNYLEEAEKG